jgi:hypothetical protein
MVLISITGSDYDGCEGRIAIFATNGNAATASTAQNRSCQSWGCVFPSRTYDLRDMPEEGDEMAIVPAR